MRQYIYHSLSVYPDVDNSALLEAMMNLMHATYVTLQSRPILDEENLSNGMIVFSSLFFHYFKDTMKVVLKLYLIYGCVQ